MTGPTPAVYEAAVLAYEDGNDDHYSSTALDRAVDAVWALARTQVAEEIRRARSPWDGVPTKPTADAAIEWAAGIAEGGGQ